MTLPKQDSAVLSARWREGVLLKRDVFSTVERGRCQSDHGEVDAVLRRLDQVPGWSYGLAYHLFSRERRALQRISDSESAPTCMGGRKALVAAYRRRRAASGETHGDAPISGSAGRGVAQAASAGVTHNDLARSRTGCTARRRAFHTDFLLALCFRRRGKLFASRLTKTAPYAHAQADLRPGSADAKERIFWRAISAPRGCGSRRKKVYKAITRGVFTSPIAWAVAAASVKTRPSCGHLLRVTRCATQAIVAFADRPAAASASMPSRKTPAPT